MLGVFAGGFGLLVGNRIIPHLHAEYRQWRGHGGADDREAMIDDRLRRAALIGGAITLHNAPEGLAMGIAFASGLENVAFVLAVVIGLQNIPDGFAFAVPASQSDVSNARVVLYTPDADIDRYAETHDWVVFTTDDDFFVAGGDHGLLLYDQIENPSPGDVVAAVQQTERPYIGPSKSTESVPDGWV